MWPSMKAYTGHTQGRYGIYIYISQGETINKQNLSMQKSSKKQLNKFKKTITAYTKHRCCAPGGQMPHPTSHLAELVKPQWRSHLRSSRFHELGCSISKKWHEKLDSKKFQSTNDNICFKPPWIIHCRLLILAYIHKKGRRMKRTTVQSLLGADSSGLWTVLTPQQGSRIRTSDGNCLHLEGTRSTSFTA